MKRVMIAALTAGTLAFAAPVFAQGTMPKDYMGPGGNGAAQVNDQGQMGPGGNAAATEKEYMGPGGNAAAQTKDESQMGPGGNAQTKEASPTKDENGVKTEEDKKD